MSNLLALNANNEQTTFKLFILVILTSVLANKLDPGVKEKNCTIKWIVLKLGNWLVTFRHKVWTLSWPNQAQSVKPLIIIDGTINLHITLFTHQNIKRLYKKNCPLGMLVSKFVLLLVNYHIMRHLHIAINDSEANLVAPYYRQLLDKLC